jgi:hypothetical protein
LTIERMTMENRKALDELFGTQFWDDELIPRMVATTENSRDQAERKMDNCVAYLKARASLPDPNSSLVCNLAPDEAWHVFILFTHEYTLFCDWICGQYLHHDPAHEAAFVNSEKETEKTVAIMRHIGVQYDDVLWLDWLMYPNGAEILPSRIVAREL